MRFRTKLFFSFLAVGLITNLIALFIVYGKSSEILFKEIQSKVMSILITSSELFDRDAVKGVVDSEGKDTQDMNIVKKQLIAIREINRRADTFIQFIYLIKKHPDHNTYYFVADISTTGDYGREYLTPMEMPKTIDKVYITQKVYNNEWGSWMSGYIPIYDDDGNELCVFGLDISIQEVFIKMKSLLIYALFALGISIVIAVLFSYFLSMLISSSLSRLCDIVEKIGKGDFTVRSPLNTNDEFNQLSRAINKMSKGLQERERLKVGFTKYVSQYALEELLKLDKPISLDGERKKVTVLFTDIRNFTKLSEYLPPEDVLKLLNEYYKEMIEIIFHYGGTLDKFMGDGMMIEFGAPLEDQDQELHAVMSAIHMQMKLLDLSKKWQENQNISLSMGVGIHTGVAVLGNIGSEKRMEYTVIGDAVNVASRLERKTKEMSQLIIISSSVYEKINEYFQCESLGDVKVLGREETISIYAIDPYNIDNQKILNTFNQKKH